MEKLKFFLLVSCLGVLLSSVAQAQVPTVDLTPSLPAEVFAGESFCFEASFTNTGPPGFGPYLLVVLPPGVSFDSAMALGAGSSSTVGVFGGSGSLDDPISGSTITGPPGGSLILVRFPVGSVVDGGPSLVATICATLDPSVTIGVPLDIEVIPAYEFGDTATGDNGSIVGGGVTSTVTPVLALLEKNNTAPEDERPPAASFPFEYVLSLDIANGSTLDNVVLADVLPADIQWTGGAISAVPGSCAVTDPNAPPTPGGTVTVDCGSVTGVIGGPEIEVRIPVFVVDSLDETVCDTDLLINTASADFDFQGIPFPTLTDGDDDDGENGLLVTHAAIQKSASPAAVSPGDTVTYSHAFQVSDFATANSFTIVDVLPDGTTFVGTLSLVVGGGPVAITPVVAADTPGPGQTTVTWDVAAVAGSLPAGTTGTLIYEATIDQTYDPAGPNAGSAVIANDPLTNTANLQFGLTAGAAGCSNTTAATVTVLPVALDKSIVAPSPAPSQFMPGDTLTFRLTMTIPSGDVEGVQFVDFLPLPVFDVADFDPMTDAVLAPPDTGDSTPTVTTDVATNSVTIDWSDVTVSPTRTVVLSIDLTVTVSDDPFGDGLSLTNILQATSDNTPGETLSGTTTTGLQVGAPELVLTKGISATTGSGTLAPAPGTPVDSDLVDADAGDMLTFVLTVENVGSEPAFQVTITDPGLPGLTACSIDSVTDGLGAAIATSGTLPAGLLLGQPLAENDGNPAAGGPPYGTDTALVTFTCSLAATVQPGEVLLNTASAVWAPTATSTGFFPPVSDQASATVARPEIAKVIAGVAPGYQAAAPFGNNEPVHVGEIVTYQVVVEVPEGMSNSTTLNDQIDRGLAFVDVVSVVADGGVTTDLAGGFPAVAAAAVISNVGAGVVDADRRLTLDFGNLTAVPDNDTSNDTVTITYRAVVLNWSNNNRGDRRNNRADWISAAPGGGTQQVRASAPNVRIREADLSLGKSLSATVGDAGDTVQVSLTVANQAPSNADAFDVVLNDIIPTGMTFAGSLVVAAGCTATPTSGPSEAGGLVTASWDRIDLGQSCTVTFDVTLDAGVTAGSTIENCADITWESIRDADQPLPAAPTNTLSAERTGDPADAGGNANTYLRQACDRIMIADVAVTKSILSTSEGHSADSEVRLGVTDLTIGEEITFELLVTLPEGMISELVVSDFLPASAVVLEALAARVEDVGTQITLPGAPSIVLNDGNLGDGLDDTVVIDFGGPVTNTADGTLDAGDRIRIEIDAVVVDVAVNSGGDQASNSALVQFGPGLDGGDTEEIDLVEPDLSILKQADLSSGDAGDVVTFTLRIEHSAASTADAFDVELSDSLPPELVFAGFVGSGLGTCTDPPDSGPSEAAGTISASWSGFPRPVLCEIVFQASLALSVTPGETVTNQADLAWASLDTTVNGEERAYGASSSWQILVTEPGLSKAVTATDVAETEDDQKGAAEDLTIGEEVTFEIVATFIDGTTPGAVLSDQLPNADVVLRLVSSRIVSIGADLTVPAATAGDAGDDCLPGCDGDADGERDQAVWDLGDVVNVADPDPAPDVDDEIVFEVVAVVVDSVNNEGAPGVDLDQRNSAQLSFTGGSLGATAAVDIVAPLLEVDKRVLCRDDDSSNTCEAGEPSGDPLLVDASDRVIYEVEITHAADSTAAAFGLALADLLPMAPGTAYVAGSLTVVAGLPPDSIATPGGSLVLTWDDPISLSTTYLLRYAVTIGAGAVAGVTYPNEATLDWQSSGDPMATEGRDGQDTDDASVTVFAPTIVKQATGTSLDRTGLTAGDPMDFDLTLGELVTYNLTVVFSEGTTTNAVVTDVSQNNAAGLLRVVGASIVGLGNNISTSLPGSPVITAPDTVVFDFGTVTNAPDGSGDANDTITLEVTAQVVNDDDPLPPTLNVDGEVLANTATLTFGMAGSAASTASVDVVEPALSLAKTLGPIVDGRLQVTLTATNSGTAPGYDLILTDVLDETIFVPSSAQPVGLAADFQLAQVSAAGATTVTISVAGDPTMPGPGAILDPGESQPFVFTVELQGGAMPVTTTIDNEAMATFTSLPGGDPEERIYSDTAMDQVLIPSLMLTKSASPPMAVPGQTVTFTLTIENMGDAAANDLVVFDTVPANSTSGVNAGWFVAPPPSTTACDFQPTGTVCFTELPLPLAAGDNTSVSFAVVVDDPLAAGVVEIFNQGQVDSTELPVKDSNIAQVPIDAAPDLTVSKDDGGVTAGAGSTVVYTLLYDNVGTQTATGVVLVETVPANSTSAINPGWEVAPVGSGVACDGQPAGTSCVLSVGTVTVGGGGTASFSVTVDDPLAAGVTGLVNTTSISDDGSNGADQNPTDNTGNDSTPIDAAPDLALSKTDGGATSMPGGTVTFTLSYANNGDQGATGVVITETVPANTVTGTNPGWEVAPVGSGVACDGQPAATVCVLAIGPLASGANGTASFVLVIDNPLPAGVLQIANTASIADDGSNGSDPTPGDNTGSDSTPVTAAPDLQIVKSDGGAIASPGGTITYTSSYGNVGDQGATGVVITETVPADTVSGTNPGWEVAPVGSAVACDAQPAGTVCVLAIGSLAVGQTGMATFVVMLDDPKPAGVEQIDNTASIADDGNNGPDQNPGDNTDGEQTPADAGPDLFVTKDDGDVTVMPGNLVVYTLSYGNEGTQNATGVVLTETVPVNTISGTNPGWEVAPLGSAVACDGQPTGTSCVLAIGDLDVGENGTASFELLIDDPLPAGVTEVANTASIGDDGSGGPDLDPTDDTGGDSTPVDAAPDLAISKDDGDLTSLPGGTVVYSLSYANNGDQDATGVVLTETVPANTISGTNPGWELAPVGSGIACDGQPAGTVCLLTIGALGSGASGTASFVLVIDNPLPAGVTEVLNTVSIADDGSNGADPTPGDNTNSDGTPVTAAPDLQVTKDDSGVVASPGGTITYTLAYSNVGDQDATGVVLLETVPLHTSSATNPGWEVAPVGSGIACDAQPVGTVCVLAIGALAVGESGSASFVVLLDDPKPAGVEEILNTVSIEDDGNNGPDQNPDDNSDSEQTPAEAGPDLFVTKDDGDVSAVPGDTVVYTLSYGNQGTQNATGVVLTETVPMHTSSASNPGWEVAPVGSGVACDSQPAATLCELSIGALAVGEVGTASFAVVIDDPLAAGVTEVNNTVAIGDDGSGGPDQNPDDNDGGDSTPVDGMPMLDVFKTAEQPPGDGYMPGDQFQWAIELVNTGNQDLANLTLVDVLPPEVAYVAETMGLDGVVLTDAPADDAGTYDGDITLTVSVALVPAGQSVIFTFTTSVTGVDPEEDGLVFNQALVTDGGGNVTPSDDPGSGDVDDPTSVPLQLFVIPTLGEVGLALLSLLLAGAAAALLRRRRGALGS